MTRCYQTHGFRKWTSVFGMFLLLCPLGAMWYWGNMAVYVDSYVIKKVDRNSDVEGPWMMSCFEVGASSGLFLSFVLIKYVGKRLTIVCGTLFVICGLVGSYFLIEISTVLMQVVLGIFTGLGEYVTGGVAMMYAVEWANDDFGFINSLAQSGLTAGSIVINQIVTFYINPDNLPPDTNLGPANYFFQDEVLEKVPSTYLILTSIVFLCSVFGMLLVKDNKEKPQKQEPETPDANVSKTTETNNEADNDISSDHYKITVELRQEHNNMSESTRLVSADRERVRSNSVVGPELSISSPYENSTTDAGNKVPELSPLQLAREPIAYVYSFFALLGTGTYVVLTTYYKKYGQLYILDDHFLTDLSIALLIAMTIARTGWGKLMDRFGVKMTFVVHFSSCGLTSLAFYFSPFAGRWCYSVVTLAFACAGSAIYVIVVYAAVKTFGEKYFILNFGITCLPATLTMLFVSPSFKYLITELGWFSLYMLCSGWNLLGLIMAITILPEGR